MKSSIFAWLCAMIVVLGLAENRAWGFFEQPQPAPGQIAAANPSAIGENYDAWRYDAPDCAVAAKTTAGTAGDLSGSIAGSFRNGQYSSWIAETDTVLYRATNFAQDANGPGRFFGLSRPANSMDAEMMYNLKAWGNNATELLEYRIPAGTRGYIGPVHNGTGTQLFIPNTNGVQLLDQSPLFINELKFITP